MNDTLKERILERIEALGMNPSSVSLEAGLSRSAVRDILSGKAKNPGIATIIAISRALKCSDNYLMGFSDEKHYQEATDILIDASARLSDSSGTIEAGIFRQAADPEIYQVDEDPFDANWQTPKARVRTPLAARRRYIGRDLYMYVVGDNSLLDIAIMKDDILMAVHDRSGEGMEFRDGRIFVVSHKIPGLNAEELSARIVKQSGGKTILVTASNKSPTPPIVIDASAGAPHTYLTASGGTVEVEGVVVEVTRQLDM